MTAFTRIRSHYWQDYFLLLLPRIESYASRAFRHLDSESRSEAVSDVIANAWVAFARLAKVGKASLAYPTVLARYGVAQFREGRRVGTPTNTRDVTSPAAQRKHQHHVTSIHHRDADESWKTIAVEDKSTGPAEIAQFRIDFNEWLDSLSLSHRRLANKMCEGRSTSELSADQNVSRGRISQVRRELEDSWRQFTSVEADEEVMFAS